jgi:uncharacterized protein YbjT (DUF2867 family)
MILITGGTGTVGSRAARALLAAGAPVRVLVREPARAGWLEAEGAEVRRGDLDDESSLRAAMEGVERVLLIAPLHPRMARREGAVIEAAVRAGVRHVVKLSTLGVLARAVPGSPPEPRQYQLHRRAERHLERSGLAWTQLRPGPFMQNLIAQRASIVGGGVVRGSWGSGRMPYVDAGDVAAVAVRALSEPGHQGRAYALIGPETLSGDEIAQRLSAALGRRIRYLDVPPEVTERTLRERGAPAWLVGAMLEVMARVRSDEPPPPPGDDVERVTGRPARGLEEFAREHAAVLGSVTIAIGR